MFTIDDIRWAAEECERQQSGELSVYHLCEALEYAAGISSNFSLDQIRILGFLVEPRKNENGFRRVPVYFANGDQAIPWQQIESALTSLLENGESLFPTEWYKEFEKIHPFVDGNGRVGAILFNLKMGKIHNLITPPNVFG